MERKHWYLIDDRTGCRQGGDIFEDDLGEITEAEAIDAMIDAWDGLTHGEQRDGREYYVCTMEQNDEGLCDFDTAENVVDIWSVRGTFYAVQRTEEDGDTFDGWDDGSYSLADAKQQADETEAPEGGWITIAEIDLREKYPACVAEWTKNDSGEWTRRETR